MRKMPKQERAEQTVKAIFDATLKILEKDGADGLNTNKVAAIAGISIGTVYQYFPNRQAILLALAKRENEMSLREHGATLEKRGILTLEESLREHVRLIVKLFGGKSDVHRAILEAIMRDAPASLYSTAEKIAAILKTKLSDGTRPGLRPPSDAMLFVMTRALASTIRAAVLERSPLLHTSEFEDELVRMVMTIVTPNPALAHLEH